jgi:signal transduction histidine kinase
MDMKEACQPDADALGRRVAELEERLRASSARIDELTTELEAFAYAVSHDLRAPLRAVRGFSSALVEDYGAALDVRARDYAQRADAAAARLDAMLDGLLAYSRVQRQEVTLGPVSLEAVVADVLERHAAQITAQHAETAVVHPLPAVIGHREMLTQVVSQLLVNALKFVAEGNPAHVRLRAEMLPGTVRLVIEDDGIGMAPEHMGRIFGVFERLHSNDAYPGVGMGLAIVRRALTRMAGRAGASSSPGSGSQFWVELPAA